LLIIFIICAISTHAADSYKPYLHDPVVPKHPSIDPYGSYSTELFTGAATYEVPIEVPPGVNGLQPDLKLSYNSYSAQKIPSIVGTGWAITDSVIVRDINFTQANTSNDNFILYLNSQKYDLIWNGSKWYTRIESYFNVDNYSDYWSVNDRSGNSYKFGHNDDSKLQSNQQNYIIGWYLDTITDTHGNAINYNYKQDPYPNDIGTIYLDNITYGSNLVDFIFQDSDREDLWESYKDGIHRRITRRLSGINISNGGNQIREYTIHYSNIGWTAKYSIKNITIYGKNGSYLPSISFNYTPQTYGWTQNASWDLPEGADLVDYLDHDMGTRLLDVNGDGLTDIVNRYNYNQPKCWLNTGYGWQNDTTWEPPNDSDFILWNMDVGVRTADVNCDGFPDIIQNWNGAVKAWLNNKSGWVLNSTWNPPVLAEFSNTAYTGMDEGTRIADVNGDCYPDLIRRINNVGYAWINNGSGWVNDSTWITPPQSDFVNYEQLDVGIRLVDVNGDGLVDIVKNRAYIDRQAWINNGSGWVLDLSYLVPYSAGFAEVDGSDMGTRFVDLNADGLPDLVRRKDGYVGSWINNGSGWVANNTWQTPLYTAFVEPNGRNSGTRIADVNGDGFEDLIRAYGPDRYSYISNAFPYILISVTYVYGGSQNIKYIPSTSLNNSGEDNISDLNFNVWLVSNVTKDNGMNVSGSIFYNYSGGYYDQRSREFRGFSYATEKRPDGVTVEHYYHQGDALQGKEYRTEIKNSSGALYYKSESKYSVENISGYHIVELDGTSSFSYDGSDVPKITNTTYSYDDFGNVINISYNDDKYEFFEYVHNLTAWIVNRVKHYQLKDSSVVKESWYLYDNLSYGYVSKGDLTLQEDYLDTGNNPISRYNYDSYGNLIEEKDTLNHSIFYEYDASHTFPVRITNAKGHVVEREYDEGTGNLLWQKDSNGVYTNYSYDAFGRIIKEILPYDSNASPTKEYIYSIDGVAPEKVSTKLKRDSGTFDTDFYYDGFGNLIQAKSDSEDGMQTVTDIYYDSSFRAQKTSNPYFISASDNYTDPTSTYLTGYEYDALGRVIEVVKPDDTNITTLYDRWNITVYDENGNKKRYELDEFDRIFAVYEYHDGVEYKTSYSYDSMDNIVGIDDALGNDFEFSYDSLGRKVSINDPDLGSWSYVYDTAGNLVSQTDSRGVTVSMDYDELNRLLQKNGSSLQINYTYDAGKNGTLSSVVGSSVFSFQYDDRLRVNSQSLSVDNESLNISYSYDSQDRVLTKTLPDGTVIDYSYNDQNFLASVAGIVSDIDYNAMGMKLNVSYANGPLSEYSYDPENLRLKSIKTGSLQDLSYMYDPVGNIVSIYGGSVNTTMAYDDLDRLISAARSDSGFDYDYGYNIIGNMMNITGMRNYTYSYGGFPLHAPVRIDIENDKNRLLFKNSSGSITAWLGDSGNIWLAGVIEQESSHNRSDNDEWVIRNTGEDVLILDKETGSLYIDGTLHENSGLITEDPMQDEFIIKDEHGAIALLINESGSIFVTDELKLFSENRLVFKNSSGDITAMFDDSGNILLAGSLDENTGYSPTDNDEWIIRNNGDEVLILDTVSGDLYIDNTVYENYGNISEDSLQDEFIIKDSGGDIVLKVTEVGFLYTKGMVVEDKTFRSDVLVYDNNGNLIQDMERYYEYDDFNRLVRVREFMPSGRVLEEYEYDSDGQRIKKVSGNDTYYYAGKDFVRVVNGSGAFDTVYYYLGNSIVAKNESGVTEFFHPDHLGSTSLVTDSAGNEVETIEYYPFGAILSSTKQDYLYEGKELDSTNLQYFGARYYDTGTMRMFTQPDSLLPNIYDPQQLNRYAFERNSPYVFIDEDGHYAQYVIAGGVGFIAGSVGYMLTHDGSGWSHLRNTYAAGSVAAATSVGTVAFATYSGAAIASKGIVAALSAAGKFLVGATGEISNQILEDEGINLKDASVSGALNVPSFGLALKPGSRVGTRSLFSENNLKLVGQYLGGFFSFNTYSGLSSYLSGQSNQNQLFQQYQEYNRQTIIKQRGSGTYSGGAGYNRDAGAYITDKGRVYPTNNPNFRPNPNAPRVCVSGC